MLAHAEKRQPPLPPDAALDTRNLDVLVVHDDEHFRQFLESHLRRAGYHVRVADSAIEASILVLEGAPDVMVLDIDRRGINCFEFLAELRTDRTVPFFPVVYLTADRNVANCARELGAACVHKPVQPEKLLATVASSA